MGSVFNRGTRAKPKWYGKYKDADEKWKTVATKQPTKTLARRWVEQIEARLADGLVGIEQPSEEPKVAELMEQWLAGLTNRNAQDDRKRCENHVLPVFGDKRLKEVGLPFVMGWLDDMKAAGKIAGGTQRHNLNQLSRFFSWAIERGHTEVNPVKQIPQGRRPRQAAKTVQPWIDDDAVVRKIIEGLPDPIDKMFYLGNRSGLRTGEICGLRLSDFEYLDEGVIRVRYSYDGPLKEDKNLEGKTKWVPAADDCEAFLRDGLVARKNQGAGPESYVFPSPIRPGKPARYEWTRPYWKKVQKELELETTWYQATRHSFVSRLLQAGATLDEVSSAVGHSSPIVTRRYYDHFIRKTYSKQLRSGLGLGDSGQGEVVRFPGNK